MKAEIVNGNLVITAPLQPPTPSKTSGKNLIVVSTGGGRATAAIVDGKPIDDYKRLAERCRFNLRAMLQAVEGGDF
jgi:hypothetical protein